MEIRKAKASDARGIIDVNVKTWCTTYTNIIPNEILQHRVDAMEESIKKCEQTVEADDNVLVAIQNEKIVGIASYGKTKTLSDESAGELYSIYVLKEYQGQGIGEQLFNKIKNILKNNGYKKIVVTCIKENPYNKFYQKMGGKIIDVIISNICGLELEENLIIFDIK